MKHNKIVFEKKIFKTSESRKFVVRFLLHWRPPEGILFHWRGFEKMLFTIQNFTQGDLHSTGGIQMSSWGVIIPLERFSYPS